MLPSKAFALVSVLGFSLKVNMTESQLPLQESNRLAKLVPEHLPEVNGSEPKINIPNCLKYDPAMRAELQNSNPLVPKVLDFNGLITGTEFASLMRDMLQALSTAYDHPVDIEYTVNINDRGQPRINLVQCRPLQTRGLGEAVAMPTNPDPAGTLLRSTGNFMGGNVRLPLEYIVTVRPAAYLALSQQDRYAVARGMGVLNKALLGKSFMIMAPGRWGTTTPSLGIPVHFSEISNAAVMAEFTYPDGGFIPELSQGSHFFQDLVESGIFYLAIFDHQPDVVFVPELVVERPNRLTELVPELHDLVEVLHVASFDSMVLYSDIASQQVIIC